MKMRKELCRADSKHEAACNQEAWTEFRVIDSLVNAASLHGPLQTNKKQKQRRRRAATSMCTIRIFHSKWGMNARKLLVAEKLSVGEMGLVT